MAPKKASNTSSSKTGQISLHKGTEEGKLLPGWYKITVTTVDKYGEEVKAEKLASQAPAEGTKTEAKAKDTAVITPAKEVKVAMK